MIKNRWDENIASSLKSDLELRVYSSRLLGSDSYLVLHGGGNTSVKIDGTLYVKGSGWDLESIEKEGFAPCNIDALLELLKLDSLSDSDMVKAQKESMTDSSAPNPSVEAILHALIPYKFVDHTHADSVVTISNSAKGATIIEEIYGDDFLIVPYVMPGFILAKEVYELSKSIDWSKIKGIILHNHGIFTFGESAKESYDSMIEWVAKSEKYLEENTSLECLNEGTAWSDDDIKKVVDTVSKAKGFEVSYRVNSSPLARAFSSNEEFFTKGILTPEHIIRTKRTPAVFECDFEAELLEYMKEYEEYFKTFAKDEIMLNPAPNWAILKNHGTIAFGKNEKEAKIIEDINNHTMEAIIRAENLGGFCSLSLADSFAMEYWELEQAKLRSQK